MENNIFAVIINALCIVFLLSACNYSGNKKLDVKDCTLTLEDQYDIVTNENNSYIVLSPRTLSHQLYIINFYGTLDKASLTEQCINKQGASMSTEGNLKICIAPAKVDGTEANSYTVLGASFFMVFASMNNNAKQLLKSCNDTWRN